jgi:hypothetical protein
VHMFVISGRPKEPLVTHRAVPLLHRPAGAAAATVTPQTSALSLTSAPTPPSAVLADATTRVNNSSRQSPAALPRRCLPMLPRSLLHPADTLETQSPLNVSTDDSSVDLDLGCDPLADRILPPTLRATDLHTPTKPPSTPVRIRSGGAASSQGRVLRTGTGTWTLTGSVRDPPAGPRSTPASPRPASNAARRVPAGPGRIITPSPIRHGVGAFGQPMLIPFVLANQGGGCWVVRPTPSDWVASAVRQEETLNTPLREESPWAIGASGGSDCRAGSGAGVGSPRGEEEASGPLRGGSMAAHAPSPRWQASPPPGSAPLPAVVGPEPGRAGVSPRGGPTDGADAVDAAIASIQRWNRVRVNDGLHL